MNNNRLTITEVAKALGVTPRTIMRWEKSGKITKSKRDWRGWRFYHREDLEEIRRFYESTYDYNEAVKSIVSATKNLFIIAALTAFLAFSLMPTILYAEANTQGNSAVIETPKAVDINLAKLPTVEAQPLTTEEAVTYTLGPDDVISIEVRRHPEFGGQYTVNSEGKVEYKFVGDIAVTGLTKKQVKEKITTILSDFIIDPEVDVQIMAYMSKVYYVVGEVNRPGKFYMKGDAITVQKALVEAGLPTLSAAMRRCRLITPNEKGKGNYVNVNVYSLLYEGNLKCNHSMKPGDVLYIPATAIAKVMHVISPVTSTVSSTAGAATSAATTGAMIP